MKLAAPVRHGCCSAGLACPLGSSTAAGSSVRPNQGLKARPHALNRFALADKQVHRSSLTIPPLPLPPPSPGPARYLVARDHGLPALRHVHLLMNVLHRDLLVSARSLALKREHALLIGG